MRVHSLRRFAQTHLSLTSSVAARYSSDVAAVPLRTLTGVGSACGPTHAELTTQRRVLDKALGRPLRTCSGLADATMAKESAPILVRWFLILERVWDYKLAQRLATPDGERIGEDTGSRRSQGRTGRR